ncbi:amidohydrolase family protein [Thermomicrobiaceae bacterium CFH 74404]|uniref:Amidohydrolase family protein n=1 Tax=Thermalbibacter longus TaxID=2951981 RepID=A0AA41WBZ4_9BACT|nr:amidohydrolase family protein [Thermalbibacter longus]MCM8749952.1 amidohydrolase family protein [Thermalbibacter longus]
MARIVITNGTIIDGTGRDPIERGTVIIEGDRIASVEDRAHRGEPGDTVVDATGQTVLPGLINLHDHAYRKRLRYVTPGVSSYREASNRLVRESPTYLAVLSASNLLIELRAGITTTREVGAGYDISVTLRRMINEGLLPGPRMFVAGQAISMTGGHGYWMARQADGPDEVRKAVREQLLTGVDHIKFMATAGLARYPQEHPQHVEFTEEELRAGIEEAHKHGKKTCAHAYATEGIKNAIRAGIDSIEHGVFLDEEAIHMMIERGVDLVPTMSGLYRVAEYYREAGDQATCDLIYDLALRPQQESFAQAVQAGVRYGVGTDSAGEMVEEMLLMQEAAGISAMDCIVAATGNAAKIMGMEDRFGTLTPGLAADVIVVNGDPLSDVRALRSIVHVIRDGKHFVRDGELYL